MFAARHYSALLAHARRHARRDHEAEDLVQEVLIGAVVAGRGDLSRAENRRWAFGAIRKRAAFDARGAARRRIRETQWADLHIFSDAGPDQADMAEILMGLPRSLRVVAALALTGHTRREIGYLLDLSDAALRQRVRQLKSKLVARGVATPRAMSGLSLDLAYGAIRDALLPALSRHEGVFASHDPDGHLFVVRRSRTA